LELIVNLISAVAEFICKFSVHQFSSMRSRPLLIVLASFLITATTVSSQTVLFEDFNGGIPASWSVVDGGTTTDTWVGTTNGYNNNYLDGSQFAFVDSDGAGNAANTILSEQLISPVINGTLYTQLFVEFDHYYRQFSADTGYVEVYNGNSWVTLAGYSNDMGAWNAPAHPVFDLSPYLNANLRVRFRYEDFSIWAWWWAVDNVRFYAPLTLDATVTTLAVPTGSCGLSTTETIGIVVKNEGSSAISNVPVSFQVNSGGIITEIIPGPIPSGATLSYNFTTGANLSAGGLYDIVAWTALNGDGDSSNDSLAAPQISNHVLAGSMPYDEDFENGPAGWFASGQNSTWEFGTPAKTVIIGASSGANAWVTGGLTGDYADLEQSQVEGPCFDLSNVSNPWVGMNIWWNAEWSWDGAALQTSVDGGQTWATVGALGDPWDWYTDNTIDGTPGGQTEGWSGRAATNDGSNGYRRAVHGLAGVAGQAEVILRVVFGSDGSVRDDGIAFDDFTIANGPSLNLGPDTMACDSVVLDAGLASSWSWNNGGTTRNVTADSSGTWSVTIRDSFGFPVGDQIQVTIFDTDALDLGADTSLCSGAGLSLMADPAAQSFLWNTGAVTPNLPVNVSGQYSVQVTYPPGCMASDTIDVSVSSLQAAISLVSDTLCRGSVIPFADGSTGAQTWWWDFGDGGFSNQPNPIHVYSSGGTFQVSLTVTDSNCSHTVTRLVYVDLCTSLESRVEASGTLYPNPTRGMAHLKFISEIGGSHTFEIRDSKGSLIYGDSWNLNSGPNLRQIDVKDLAAGIYFVRVSGPAVNWSEKLVLVR
jgi:hypothetical protein